MIILLRLLLPLENRKNLQMMSPFNIRSHIQNHIKETFEDLGMGKHLFVVEKLKVLLFWIVD